MSDNLNEYIDKIIEEARKDILFPYKEFTSQLNLIEKSKEDSDRESTDDEKLPNWTILHYNSALINIISCFEYFFRELILNENIVNPEHTKNYYDNSKGKFKISFQKYVNIQKFLDNEFNINIETKLIKLEIDWLRLLLYERHLLVHNGGIIDKDFMDLPLLELKLSGYSIGRRLWIESKHIDILIGIVRKVGDAVEEHLKSKKAIHEFRN